MLGHKSRCSCGNIKARAHANDGGDARKTWGFGLCFLHLRNVKGHPWNHRRVYRIYCALELNLRIKPRKRLKRDNPDALRCLRPRTSPGRWTSWPTG